MDFITLEMLLSLAGCVVVVGLVTEALKLYFKKINAFFEMFTSADGTPKKEHYHKFIKSIFTDRKLVELFKDAIALIKLLWSILLWI